MISFRSFVRALPYRVWSMPPNPPQNWGGWITPRGGVESFDPVTYHITDLVSQPIKFGLTPAQVLATYRPGEFRHTDDGTPVLGDEEIGHRPRAELLKAVFRRGWVRYRRVDRNWEVELYRLTKGIKTHLAAWATGMIERGAHSEEVVTIFVHDTGRRLRSFTLRDLAGFRHLDEVRRPVV